MFLAASALVACSAVRAPVRDEQVSALPVASLGFDSLASRVVFPLVAGRANGVTSWFVVLETSDAADAARRGITHVPRLAELRGTAVVQRGTYRGDELEVEFGVDFTPARVVRADETDGFPPQAASPGAIAADGYSPYVEFADGVVRNISVVANATGQADRVTLLNVAQRWVVFRATRGYASGRTLWYVSTEASDPMVAAIEAATYAPRLARATPPAGMAELVAMVNGPRRAADAAERHGMESAMLGEGDPLNILAAVPGEPGYAPLWDLHMALWTSRAVGDGTRERLRSVAEVRGRMSVGLVAGMGESGALQRAAIVVNCPVIARR